MARGKLIPKENLFYVIDLLGDKATWTNIYNNAISEQGKRYASNDIGFSLEYYIENKMIEAKQMNKKSQVYSVIVDNDFEDFLRNVSNQKKTKLEHLVGALDNKKIFEKNGGFVAENHEDFTKFMTALEDSFEFINSLLHTREDSDYDGDSMTGLADTQAYAIFNSKITYVIKLTKKSIDECCKKLKDGREQNERVRIGGMLSNVAWSFTIKML
jgi:hypothetical protein